MKMYKGNSTAEVESGQKSVMERNGWSTKKESVVKKIAKPKAPVVKAASATDTTAKTTVPKTATAKKDS